MWLLKAFMDEPARSSLSMRLSHPKSGKAKKGKLTSYSEAINYLLQTYASDDVVAEAEADLRHFVQNRSMSPQEYATALTLKVLRCGPVYTEARIIGIYIEGLRESIHSTVRTYRSEHPAADLNTLAHHVASVSNLTGAGKDRNRARRNVLPVETESASPPMSTPEAATPSKSPSQPSLVLSEESIFTNELLMLQAQGSQEADLNSSAIMDSGDYCRVCYEYQDHASSKCPYLQGKPGFVAARNKNFNAFLKRRQSLPKSKKPPYRRNRKRNNAPVRRDNPPQENSDSKTTEHTPEESHRQEN